MSSIKTQPISASQRRQATADALGSVRAEGLQPSVSAMKRLDRYASGKISADQLHRETLAEVRERNKTTRAR